MIVRPILRKPPQAAPSFRSEKPAPTQSDKTALIAHPAAATSEQMVMSEKDFLRSHTLYSAISSWLFAIAGATNIGVLCALSSKVLTASEQGKPFFKSADPAVVPVFGNKKYNRIAIGMTAFGAVCMAVSNWLESKKVVTEWQLGAGKLQRKMNIADERTHMAPADPTPANAAVPAAEAPSKNWAASAQTKIDDTIQHSAARR